MLKKSAKAMRLALYSTLMRMAQPILPLVLRSRLKKGKEIESRLGERLGRSVKARPKGNLVWFHAASVGESVMLLPLIERLLALPSTGSIMVTTQTVTAAELMAKRLPEGAFHQFAVIDTPKNVERFLGHWRPDLAIFAESEIWPNMIRALWEKQIPLALINARMSEKSLDGWKNKAGKTLFDKFELILPADQSTATGISEIVDRNISLMGNLKSAGLPLGADETRLKLLQDKIGKRPVWCAASTHRGEDEICLAAHDIIRKKHKDALLILVPRHPERGDEIAKLVADDTLATDIDDVTDESNVLLLAEMGVLGLAYRAAPISLIGGSLLPELSGHNPLEPARLESAVLSGPHVKSFAEIYDGMGAANAFQSVETAKDIANAVKGLWSVAPARKAMTRSALEYAGSHDQILDDVWSALLPLIPS